ncbi:methyl-accepting chemotaxis protein [Kineococcus gynurae]|uniref:Methyl-accepting chemotaxis protein n=1 Tax=Kineococcus gynurae TaxID=452979 RepID=A0ABV5LPB5_9ACTN
MKLTRRSNGRSHAGTTALSTEQTAREEIQNATAVADVLSKLTAADDPDRAIMDALATTRDVFGWAYGSLWQIDEATNVLTMRADSGTVNPEFQKVSASATFARGIGLAGRVWAQKQMIFVPDLGQVTDCVRAPVAQRAGVKAGVCLPIVVGGDVIATMDFFTTEELELSASRRRALESVAALVGQTLERINRADELRRVAAELVVSIDVVARSAAEAAAKASEAVAGAEEAMQVVTTLADSSTAIGSVARVISGIAAQTNLLALNATIEAARAGEIGRGFAVVAGEVKELAQATATATDDVTRRVEAIQSDSSNTSYALARITSSITEIHEIQASLASVLEEQSAIAAMFRSL